MRFSIILPSLLADYPGSAPGRDKKLIRAIQSCIDQTFTDFELIVIADGCPLTEYLVKKNFGINMTFGDGKKYTQFADERIKLLKVDRTGLWGNAPRNAGIEQAKGEYIIYIDSDDKWGPEHLFLINNQIGDADWVYFNDYAFVGKWIETDTDPTLYGHCGTSTICHASKLGLRWNEAGYGHDFKFIQQLLAFPNHKKIATPEYYVCHVGQWSV